MKKFILFNLCQASLLAVSAVVINAAFPPRMEPDCPIELLNSPDIVFYPDNYDSRAYYECIMTNGGFMPFRHLCHYGTYYCSEKQQCAWRWDEACAYADAIWISWFEINCGCSHGRICYCGASCECEPPY